MSFLRTTMGMCGEEMIECAMKRLFLHYININKK